MNEASHNSLFLFLSSFHSLRPELRQLTTNVTFDTYVSTVSGRSIIRYQETKQNCVGPSRDERN